MIFLLNKWWIRILTGLIVAAALMAGISLFGDADRAAAQDLLQDDTRFAVIGDFGSGNDDAAAVAALVHGWDVDFIITTGDNYYGQAGGKTGVGFDQYDNSVGRNYCSFLSGVQQPLRGQVDCPPEEQSQSGNNFFPSIGNHDRTDTVNGLQDYLDYFTLPGEGYSNSSGSERFYEFVRGPVHFFAIDSDSALRNSDEQGQQRVWLENALKNSTSPWQVVYFHHAAYSSARHGNTRAMQWPFAEWGADLVFQGHDHVYERVEQDGIQYITSGIGGRYLYDFDTKVEGSVVRHNGGFGAVVVSTTEDSLNLEAWSVAKSEDERQESTSWLVDCWEQPADMGGCVEIGQPQIIKVEAIPGWQASIAALLLVGILVLILQVKEAVTGMKNPRTDL